jgi:hypothetical protein
MPTRAFNATFAMLTALWLCSAAPVRAQDCDGVDSLGQCEGTLLRVCTNNTLQETDCVVTFGQGYTCLLTPPLQAAQCAFVAPDGGLPVDASTTPDASNAQNPSETSGCSCIRPGLGDVAGSVGLFWLLRRRPSKRAPRTP